MSFADSKPKLRMLEPLPINHEGKNLVVLRDPTRLSDKSLTVSPAAYWITTLLNGEISMKELHEKFKQQFNTEIPLGDIESLVGLLDKSFFIDNENFESYKNYITFLFHGETVRKSALAGTSYPKDKDEISKELDGYLDGHDSPAKAPFAIVAPHIDLQVGGSTFGPAYAAIKNSQAETFLILAIGHTLSGDFFACIDKDFETPLGTTETDSGFLKNLREDFKEPIFENAFAHKDEHSAEFQVLFLQKLFEERKQPFKIVPILLSFPENIDEIDHPLFNLKRVERFAKALKKNVDAMGDRISIIAGIDLSHVGKRFGQLEGATKSLRKNVEKDDREVLSLLANNDKDGYIRLMKKINQKNHICGFPAMYLLFDLLDGKKGELLGYSQNVEGDNDSMVSFAAMAF